jgi:hypothetical protein
MTETVEVDTAGTMSGARSVDPHFDPNFATLYGRFLQAGLHNVQQQPDQSYAYL